MFAVGFPLQNTQLLIYRRDYKLYSFEAMSFVAEIINKSRNFRYQDIYIYIYAVKLYNFILSTNKT